MSEEFEELIDDLIDIQDTITHAVEHGEVDQCDKNTRARLKSEIIRRMTGAQARAEAAEKELAALKEENADLREANRNIIISIDRMNFENVGLMQELAALKEAARYHPASEFPEEDGAYIGWCAEDGAYMPFTYRKDWTVALDPRITGWWNMPQPPEVKGE